MLPRRLFCTHWIWSGNYNEQATHSTKHSLYYPYTDLLNLLLLKALHIKSFDGDIPPPSERYWRGPVLWQTDGTTWTPLNNNDLMSTKVNFTTSGDEYAYTTTLEPHNKSWLFALDFPSKQPISPISHYSYDGQLRSLLPINQRQQIRLKSNTQYRLNANKDDYIDVALTLPEGIHPRTKQLAKSWLKQSSEPLQLVNIALSYFNQNL